jgi:hypothetical protein
MRIWVCIGVLVASTVNAYATPVPEIDAGSGLAAFSLLVPIGVLVWERWSKRRS